jgi:hypothetical protein
LKKPFEPPFNADVVVDANRDLSSALQPGKSKTPPSKPRKDEERETRQSIVETPTRPRPRIAISFTATAARWASGDPRI